MANSKPVLGGLISNVVFDEQLVNAAAQLLDTNVNFTDVDGNFTGGDLIVSGLLPEDTVGIRNEGTAAGQIAVTGSDIRFGNVIVASFTGGTAGTQLVVTFNASATTAAIDALIQNLTYANSSNTPTATRDLVVTIHDAAGAAAIPPTSFIEVPGANNPFDGIDVGTFSAPTFADLDGDGDLDAVIGEFGGIFRYYRNTGTALAPVFTEQTGAANPFNGIDVGLSSTPAFADLDGDGDLDVLIGEQDGTLNFYRNTGTALAPVFTVQTGAANPFNGVDVGFDSAPTFADLDGDGDLDALIGEIGGTLRYFRNTGTALAPVFTEQTGAANPFNGVDVGTFSSPTFADLDGDGDLDALIGEEDGTLNFYRNTGTALAPVFTVQTGAANPFNGVDVGALSKPTFADLDGDGDLDAVIGEEDGVVNSLRNTTPSASTPSFAVQTGVANPFNGVDVGSNSAPTFADLDGDGDLDALIGEGDGTLKYYRNTGTALAPVFAEQVGTANPFTGVEVRAFSNLTFADLDGDGDLDALIGETSGALRYLRNTGTALAPVFIEQVGAADPFNGVNVGFYSAPTFADLDGDGKIDAVIGAVAGTLTYYRNTGTALAPVFTEQTGAANPFNGEDVGDFSKPTFADLDGDGDQDVLIGEQDGVLNYYRNTGSGFVLTVNVTAQEENPFTGGNDVVNLNTLLASGSYFLTDVTNALDGDDNITLSSTVNVGIAFNGGIGNDTITGGTGNDIIDGGAGADSTIGDGGNDTLIGGEGNDTLDGGEGLDTASYAADTQVVAANLFGGFAVQNSGQPGAQVDTLTAIENVTGGSANDFLIGDDVANRLEGGNGGDNLWGYGGNDTLIGGDGDDIIVGGNNADWLESGLGQDWLYGEGGADTLRATDATANAFNVLVGGDGNDTLIGGPTGFDYFYGGDGLTGGGNDTFVIAPNSGTKVMNDFEAAGVNDVVRLVGTPITSFAQAQAAMSFSGTINGTVLVVDAGTQVWFLGLQPNQLTAADFLFA